jgi:regulator of RNase E activity RraA
VPGDEDGVIIVPRREASGLLDAARKFYANDQAKGRSSRDGTVDRSWIEKALEAKGCEYIDGVYR